MEQILAALDVTTCGDVIARRVTLSYLLSRKMFRFLLRSSMGVGRHPWNPKEAKESEVSGGPG